MGVRAAWSRASVLYAWKRALDFGEVDGLLARHADTTSDVVPLPSSEYTNPNLYMRLSPAGESTRMGDGFIANSQEIENNHENS